MSGDIKPTSLPPTLPIFPLSGALLLPGGKLPLNIFEPRYLAMVKDALSADRIIGMVQPREKEPDPPPLFDVGCAGRITGFSETDDGRFLITLTGLSRFLIEEELDRTTPYRIVRPNFDSYQADWQDQATPDDQQRKALLSGLKAYLDKRGLGADWDAIEGAPTDILINSLAMICPFSVAEKQALLEAADLTIRAQTMVTLMSFATAEGDPDDDTDVPPNIN